MPFASTITGKECHGIILLVSSSIITITLQPYLFSLSLFKQARYRVSVRAFVLESAAHFLARHWHKDRRRWNQRRFLKGLENPYFKVGDHHHHLPPKPRYNMRLFGGKENDAVALDATVSEKEFDVAWKMISFVVQ